MFSDTALNWKIMIIYCSVSNGGFRGLNSNELFVSDQFYMAYQHFVVLHMNCKFVFFLSPVLLFFVDSCVILNQLHLYGF